MVVVFKFVSMFILCICDHVYTSVDEDDIEIEVPSAVFFPYLFSVFLELDHLCFGLNFLLLVLLHSELELLQIRIV